MIRKWTAKFRRSVSRRAASKRRDSQVPITLTFEPSRRTGSLKMPMGDLSIQGETKDLSITGISFVVSSIRVQEHYLVGDDHVLRAELQLPNGRVNLFVKGLRYKQIGEYVPTAKYMVGAQILKISEGDRAIYEEFLLGKKSVSGSLELGVDES